MGLLLVILLGQQAKQIEVRPTPAPIRFDGRIEETWLSADSTTEFFQTQPDEGAPPTERTVVYVLQDRDNLYVAFRCYADKYAPVAQLYGLEDEITIHLDPTDSKSQGYFFRVYASGLYHDGLVLDDGRTWDWSWEGVWDAKTWVGKDRYEVEVKIPFKSIRYRHGITEWGINFMRMVAGNQEHIHWIDFREQEGSLQVSKFGRLVGINPQAQGYYFELYPEAFVRYDEGRGDSTAGFDDIVDRVKPRASLNFKWDLTPLTTLNATVLPDFAQIESDPTSFNLSRYPVYLSEQRPFFVEGSEVFRMAGIGNGDFEPLNIFYSRRIGRPVNCDPVPIISGAKLTTRGHGWSFGALTALTDQQADTAGNLIARRRGFGVISGRGTLPDGSNLGMLLSGTAVDGDDHNAALGLDWGFRQGPNAGAIEAALSEHNGTAGWAVNSGFAGYLGSFRSSAVLQAISDSFSVEDVGFVPWAGLKRFEVSSGPVFRRNGGALTRLSVTPSVGFSLEPGSDRPSSWGVISVTPNFRNNCGFNVWGAVGQAHEADTGYFAREGGGSFWCTSINYSANFGGNYGYGYNYRRGYLAGHVSDWFNFTYYLFGQVALMLTGNNWWEADPAGQITDVTTILRPRVDVRPNSKTLVNLYTEFVLTTPETRFGETELGSNRVGLLVGWNFLPKSWLYLAFNDYRVDYGEGQGLELANRIGAVKLRYLFYF